MQRMIKLTLENLDKALNPAVLTGNTAITITAKAQSDNGEHQDVELNLSLDDNDDLVVSWEEQ